MKMRLAYALTAAVFTLGFSPAYANDPYVIYGTHLGYDQPAGCNINDKGLTICSINGGNDVVFLQFSIERNGRDDVRTQSGMREVYNDPRRKANLMRSFRQRIMNQEMREDAKAGFSVGHQAPQFDFGTIGSDVWALHAFYIVTNTHKVDFRVDIFEIWDGGQRDILRFDSVAMDHDADKDVSYAFVASYLQSLHFNTHEGMPVSYAPSVPPATDDHALHMGIVGVDPWDPDPFLALRTDPTARYGQRIAKLRNGTMLEILDATRPDGWWLVRTPNGQTGWAKSGAGWDGKKRSWIHESAAGYTSAQWDNAQ